MRVFIFYAPADQITAPRNIPIIIPQTPTATPTGPSRSPLTHATAPVMIAIGPKTTGRRRNATAPQTIATMLNPFDAGFSAGGGGGGKNLWGPFGLPHA